MDWRCDTLYCEKCGRDRLNVSPGVYACDRCGETTYGYVQEYIPNIWLYQKSRHSRRRWFSKLTLGYASVEDEPGLTGDFVEVVQVLESGGLLRGRNVSKYGYYLIRLASRRGIALREQPRDIKNSKIRYSYDLRLFGVVYPLLGWDVGCECPYWAEWLKEALSSSDNGTE